MRVKAVIFDFDGTLVNSLKAFTTAMTMAVKNLGLPPIPEERLVKIAKLPVNRLSPIILPSNQPERTNFVGRFIREYRKAYRDIHLNYIKPVPGVSLTLGGLHERNVSIGVITGRELMIDYVEQELAFLKLDRLIQALVTLHNTQAVRTKVDLFLECSRRLNVKPDRCAMVGDSPEDIEAGKELGALTIGVLYGFYSEEEIVNAAPNFVIRSLLEIMEVLQ